MKRVPKKNISLFVCDVRAPIGKILRPAPPAPANVLLARATDHLRTKKSLTHGCEEKTAHFSLSSEINPESPFVTLPDILPFAPRKAEAKKFLSHKKSQLKFGPRLRVKTGSRFGKRAALAISFAILVFGIIYGVSILNFKREGNAALKSIYADLQNSVQSFKNLHPDTAKTHLLDANATLLGVTNSADRYGLFRLSNILDSILPAFGAVPKIFQNLSGFMSSLLEAANAFQELKISGINYFISGDGDRLLTLLKTLEKNSDQIATNSSDLINEIGILKSLPLGQEIQGINSEENLALFSELYFAKDFLRNIILLLQKPNGFHFALFFQNPSEMRPSGGFVGSYADLFIQNGAIKNIDVRDIYDPDGQLDLKIVPPKPLQGMTVSWGARDANWFFDFPISAEKILGFLQISKMYSEKNETFDGALALNTDVIVDILDITGPIALSAYNLELSKDNFLAEVQKEVETGTNKSFNQPKKILKDFTPLLLERLKNMSEDENEKLMELISRHLEKKGVQIYFRDKTLEAFVKKYGAGGEVFGIPDYFVGDYLAVVNANVAGGKSDVFVRQTISLQSRIDTEGLVRNELTVSRKHTGDSSEYSWYKAPNQDYMKIYTPRGAKLISLTGDTQKTVYPRINYKHAGYAIDTDVAAAMNGEEFGKTFFDGWLTTKAGEEKQIVFSYDNLERISLRNGTVYTFVFDRQSGVRGGVDFVFESPAGFKWQESNKPTYEYKNDDPEKRITISLTLREI
ncbi:MAG TPA: DUF4012 domain-containing protein [Candidatus Paceibacterota bacterium]